MVSRVTRPEEDIESEPKCAAQPKLQIDLVARAAPAAERNEHSLLREVLKITGRRSLGGVYSAQQLNKYEPIGPLFGSFWRVIQKRRHESVQI